MEPMEVDLELPMVWVVRVAVVAGLIVIMLDGREDKALIP